MSSDKIDRKYSPTFCIYPWIQQMVTAQGEIQLCCSAVTERLKTFDGKDVLVSNEGLGGAWNGQALQEVRRKMLAGEKIPSCSHCYYLESIGRKSWREDANEGWFSWGDRDGKLTGRVEASRKTLQVDEPPIFLDLRPGTKCNLGCRMCNPGSSIVLHREWEKIHAQSADPELRKHFSISEDIARNAGSHWLDSPELWKDIDRITDSLQRIMIAGGEPTIIEHNYRLLELCEEKGRCGEIDLLINTNVTTLPERFVRLIKKFRSAILMLSVDGLGPVQEYIRYPSKWKVIERNLNGYLDLLKSNPNVQLSMSIVTQFLNVLYLADYFGYIEGIYSRLDPAERSRFNCSPIPLYLPEFYQIEVAPDQLRKAAAARLRTYFERSSMAQELAWVKSTIESTLRICDEKGDPKRSSDLVSFAVFNRTLDSHRGIHLKDYLPEVYSYVSQAIDYDHVQPQSKRS